MELPENIIMLQQPVFVKTLLALKRPGLALVQ